MGEGSLLLGFVTAQRLVELALAHRNTVRLRAGGAVERGSAHYVAIVMLHAAWLAGLWGLGYDRPVDRALLLGFAVLQAARLWVLASLGQRWTTRIIVVPGETPVRRGPYRFIRHPNYVIVALEIAVVPLALGLPLYAAVFSVLNAVVLAIRIRAENEALAWATGEPPPGQSLPKRLAELQGLAEAQSLAQVQSLANDRESL
jgi:methyltransferase